jgi:hypothetical protein
MLIASATACTGNLAIGGVDPDAGTGASKQEASTESTPNSGPADAARAADGATPGQDAGTPFQTPPECSNPGPFSLPTSIGSQLVGTWINCDNSIFAGAGVPIDEVGVAIRADMTWQKLGDSRGQLAPLTQHTDYGTWTAQPPSAIPGADFVWDTTELTVNPTFSADGRSMQVTTAAGGNQAILAKAVGTP